MSLERTYRSIRNLEAEKNISTSQLFDFIIGFVSEVYKHSGVRDYSGLEMGDREDLVLSAFALSDMLLSVVGKNEDIILQQDDAVEIQNTFSQIKEIRNNLSKKCKEAEALKNTKAELKEEKDKLQIENDALLLIKKECEEMEMEIDRLNDPALEGIEEKKNSLIGELKDRQSKKSVLDDQIEQLEKKIRETKSEQDKTEVVFKEKQAQYDVIKEKKKMLQVGIEELEGKKKECEEWIANFNRMNADKVELIEEYNAMYSQILTAINGVFNEDYIREHLFTTNEKDVKPTTDNYPDLALFTNEIKSIEDLRNWINALEKRIKSLLAVYQDELCQLNKCCSTITADT